MRHSRTLLSCYAITAALHVGSIMLSTLLPFHVVALGGTKTQVGLLFSVTTVVSMVLRPLGGGWADRFDIRRVIAPGVAAFAVTSLLLHLARTPWEVVALMAGLGLANGLVSMSASLLTARSTTADRRGEALGTYYLASSLGIAVAPPLGFALREVGSMPLVFAAATALAVVLAALVTTLPAAAAAPLPGARRGTRFWSGSAVPVSLALTLSTIGHSSVYGFLPLYAVSRGQGAALAWFFTIYPLWLIGCRTVLRRLSDRVGRTRVALPSMACVAGAYFLLALPPTPLSLGLTAIVLGTGTALLYPTLAALVIDRAPPAEGGLALGTLSAAWDLGIVVGSAAIGAVVDRVSYGAGFAVAGASATLGVMVLALGARVRAAAPTETAAPASP